MELDAKQIGKTVRELRKNNHKFQERFAELIEITPRTVYNIENGFVMPQLQTIPLRQCQRPPHACQPAAQRPLCPANVLFLKTVPFFPPLKV